MATLYSQKTGNWSDAAAMWNTAANGSGTYQAATVADACIIQSGHTVTLDTTGCVCLSLTVNSGGTLTHSTVANSDLVAQTTITTANGSFWTCDLSASPTVTTLVAGNASNPAVDTCITVGTYSTLTLKGYPRERMTLLNGAITAGATSAAVDDATGWQIGDKIIFATTQAYAATAINDTATAVYAAGSLTMTFTSTTGFVAGGWVLLSGFTSTNNLNKAWKITSVTSTTLVFAGADPGASFTDARGTATLLPKIDSVILTSVSGNTIGWSGGIAYDHADNGYVGNFTSNVQIGNNSGVRQNLYWSHSYSGGTFQDKLIDNVLFDGGDAAGYLRAGQIAIGDGSASFTGYKLTITNNAFINAICNGITAISSYAPVTITDNVFYSVQSTRGASGIATTSAISARSVNFADIRRCGVFAWAGHAEAYGYNLAPNSGRGLYDSFASGTQYGVVHNGVSVNLDNVDIFANANGMSIVTGSGVLTDVGNGYFNGVSASNTIDIRHSGVTDAEFVGGVHQTFTGTNLATCYDAYKVAFVDKDNDTTNQEIYRPFMQIKRDNSNTNRSTSSISIYPTIISTDCQRTLSIPCANGSSIRVIGYVKKSHATNVSATVALTGLGSSVTPFTKANDTAWEMFYLSATNSSGVDGSFTLTYTANSSSGTTNVVYFDGVPDAPFVTKARHYGFTFDQVTPNAIENDSVTADQTSVATLAASLSTALALSTKFTITGGVSESDVALAASATFQNLYDYTQAWACTTANLGYAIPCTSPAGSANLLAASDVTTTGYTLNGSGSLAVDAAYTLTSDDGFGYTYTGGTFSQAASIPAFSGGTLNIGAAGAYVFDTSGTIVINMTPTGASPPNYDLDSITANGVVDLRNTTAHAITVELSSAVAALAITSNNTGGTITVTAPIVTADISITGMANTGGANNRLQIINSSALAASDWQAATAYAAGDVVLRTSGIGSENTAGLYMRCTSGGTSGGAEPTWDTTVGNTTADNTVTWTTYAVLYYDADPAGTSLADTYIDGEEFLAGETIEIRFAEEDPGVTFKTYSTSVVATADGFSALVNETADDVYATYGLSGAAYESTFSPNYVSSYIVLDANTDFSGKSAYAYYCYLLTTSQGMYRFWGGLTGIDAGNIRNNVGTISLYFDESAGFVKQTDDVRIFRSDNTRPAVDPTTGGSGIEINWRTPVSVVSTGGSALTPTESAQLMALPSASSNATAVVSAGVLTVPKFLGLK